MHIYTYMYSNVYTWVSNIYASIRICVYVCMKDIHIYTYICIHRYQTYTHLYDISIKHLYVYMYTYCIRLHAYICIKHIHICACVSKHVRLMSRQSACGSIYLNTKIVYIAQIRLLFSKSDTKIFFVAKNLFQNFFDLFLCEIITILL